MKKITLLLSFVKIKIFCVTCVTRDYLKLSVLDQIAEKKN